MDDYPRPPLARMLVRGLTRRCPLCGARGLFRQWLRPRGACPRCQLKLDRGEADFFLGSYTLNFVGVELVLVAFIAAALLITWPDVPWGALVWVGAPVIVLAPIVLYPFSRTVWLAIDLAMRPPTSYDFPEPDVPEGRVS